MGAASICSPGTRGATTGYRGYSPKRKDVEHPAWLPARAYKSFVGWVPVERAATKRTTAVALALNCKSLMTATVVVQTHPGPGVSPSWQGLCPPLNPLLRFSTWPWSCHQLRLCFVPGLGLDAEIREEAIPGPSRAHHPPGRRQTLNAGQ